MLVRIVFSMMLCCFFEVLIRINDGQTIKNERLGVFTDMRG